MAVFAAVVKGFLHDPQQAEREKAVKILGNIRAATFDGNFVFLGELAAMALHRHGEAQVFQLGRVQLMRDAADLFCQRLQVIAELRNGRVALADHARHRLTCAQHLDTKNSQRLTDIIVQFSSNAGTLFFLGIRQATRQFMPRGFGLT